MRRILSRCTTATVSVTLVSAAMAFLALSTLAAPANATCKRLGFTVNDYGKEGPTNDAKALLDKYIAKWTAQNKVKTYTTGKKDVTCELFLDVGLFDEHTCKASADVCWGGSSATVKKASAHVAPAAAPAPAATPAAKETPATEPPAKPQG